MKKSNKIIIALVAVVAVICVLIAVYVTNKPATTKGAKQVSITVTDNNSKDTVYQTNTDAEFLSQIFDEIADLSVEGDVSEYGLFITTVNGLTADYDTDGAYWSILVNGEYGMYAADSQPVTDGDSFSLVYTIAQ